MKQLNDQYFTYRQTPVDYDGVARPSIKGNTLVWNQLVQNGNFESTSGYGQGGCTFAVANNECTITLQGVYAYLYRTQDFTTGHTILVKVDAKTSVANGCTFFVNYPFYANIEELTTSYKTYYFMGTVEESKKAYLQLGFSNNVANQTVVLKNFNAFDLTVLNDSHITDYNSFKTYFPLSYYAYNSGSLLNFNGTGIKTTGFNQWDEEWEVGGIDVQSGNIYADSTRICTKNFNQCFENTVYYNSAPQQAIVLFYDDNFGYLGYAGANARSTFTTKANARYFKFYMATAYGTTYNHDICINISDTSKNGTYEPYTSSTTSLPISTYFPTGMKSAGTVYDELSDKAITRVGSVDLGSLTWNYAGGRFQSTDLNGLIHDYTTLESPNITCAKYPTFIANYTSQTTFGITAFKDSGVMYLRVLDSAYSDSATFKTAMSGVYLNYELATYTEQDVDPIYYNFYGNGTEQLLPVNTDTPITSPLLADIIYYTVSDSEVPYRVFWAINSKGDRWDFTEREFKSFMNNPQGLGFSKTISVNRYGNAQSLTDITDNFPQPNGEILFYDSHNSTRYDKYNQFVKFLSYEPITLYYKIPVSFYSRIPNTYSLECVVGTLSKTESKTDHMLTCSINYNALSFYKGEEVEISGTGTSYTINNDSDFPIGFEITITGSPVNPYFTLTQDGEMYGEAKFTDSTAFSSVYVNSNDGEQNVELQQGGSVLPNPLSYQDLSISNGSIYVTFVKLARGESTLTIGKDSGSITGVDIVFTPIYRSV